MSSVPERDMPLLRWYARLHLLVAVVIVLSIGLIGASLYLVERQFLTKTGEQLTVLASEIAEQLDHVLFERYGDIQIAAKVLAPIMRDQAGLDRYLRLLEEQYVQYRWLAVTDENGRIVAATNPTDVGSNRSEEVWFRLVKDTRATHLKSVADSELALGGLTVGFSAPIVGAKGEWLGVVTARIGLDQLEDVFVRPLVALQSQMAGTAGSVEWQLLNRDGALLADSMLREGGETNLRTLGLPSSRLSVEGEPGFVEETHVRRGVPVVTGYARMNGYADFPGFGWSVLVRVDRDEVVVPIRRTLGWFGLMGLAIVGPTIVFVLWITRRLRVEWMTSHRRGEWLKTVLTGMGDGVVATDPQRRVAFMNSVAEELTGWSMDRAVGQDVDDIIVVRHEETKETLQSSVGYVVQEGKPLTRSVPLVMASKGGTECPVEERAAPVYATDGTVSGAVLVYRNLTPAKEQKRFEQALKESELRFQSLVRSAPDAIIVADRQGLIRSWNDAASRLFGYDEREVLGQSVMMLMPVRYRETHHVRYQQAVERGMAWPSRRLTDIYGLRQDGTEFPSECSLAMIWESGEERFVCSVIHDMTDRKRVEQRMRAEHAIAKVLAEVSSVNTAVAGVLKVVCETLGWDLGMLWRVDRRAQVLRFGESWSMPDVTAEQFETASRTRIFAFGVGLPGRVWKDSRAVWVSNVQIDENFPRLPVAERDGISGAIGFPIVAGKSVIGVMEFFSRQVRQPDEELLAMMAAIGRQIGLFLDRAQIEEQFYQAQKMDAVGKLAGGIAHDFNNLLTVISGNAELLVTHHPLDKSAVEHVEEIKSGAKRAAALTRQLLAFSRRQMLDVKTVRLNDIVTNMEAMLRRLIGAHIQFMTVLGPDAGWVRVDTGQVEQVILNLVVNARDAMERGGILTIETANVELDEEYTRQHGGIAPGSYVMLAVSDTGHGMTPDVQAHIFEPFFTTKPVGKGTGLGLASVYGIIEQSKGSIGLFSEQGRGTTFKIYLPRVVEREVQKVVQPAVLPVLGWETILLVEDEEGVGRFATRILSLEGYSVLNAEDGEAALELCARYAGPIHLLLTDVVMSRMSGLQLAERLKVLHPETTVLYMSGYADDAIVHHGEVDPDTPFLQKPFTPEALRSKVRETLGRTDSGGPSQG
ncbi:MAG: PAS domain S-box protein [Nitrospira sp.]|nr:PAS domain S-box protein [Nitrospira sp.]